MVRGRRRRLPGAQAAMRWVAADARDVTRIRGSSAGPAVAVQADVAVATVARGLMRWQRRVERRRLLVLGRRAVLVGVGSACLLQLGALASGSDGSGPWLLPAGGMTAAVVAIGLAHRTSPAAAARLLDRDLELGAGVSTALELETSVARAVGRRGLGALVLADVRGALGRSLTGARARQQPRRREAGLLATFVAALALLLVLPSPRSTTGSAAAARQATPENRALRAESGVPGGEADGAGATLQSFTQTPVDAPPLAAVQPGGTTRAGGAAPGRGHDGRDVANDSRAGGAESASRTTGQGGAVGATEAGDGSPSQAGEGQGSGPSKTAGGQPDSSAGGQGDASTGGQPHGPARAKPNGSKGDAGLADAAGRRAVDRIPDERPATQEESAPGGKPGKGGYGPDGRASSAPGTAPGRKPGRSTPGSAAVGSAPGAKSAGNGVVPQLRGGTGLPLAPAYEEVPGTSGARAGSSSPTAGGAGGAGRLDQATGTAGSGGGAGVAWVPPGEATVAAIDRGVVRGYFGSFARVNSSGW